MSFIRSQLAAESSLVESLSQFIRKLNSEEDPLVIVEGLRDAEALRDCGFDGEIFMLCHNQNAAKLQGYSSKYKKIIFLLDNDSEGKSLINRTLRILNGRAKVDLYYQRGLLAASKGKIRHIEELKAYSQSIVQNV